MHDAGWVADGDAPRREASDAIHADRWQRAESEISLPQTIRYMYLAALLPLLTCSHMRYALTCAAHTAQNGCSALKLHCAQLIGRLHLSALAGSSAVYVLDAKPRWLSIGCRLGSHLGIT